MNMVQKLKKRWGIHSTLQTIVICVVFALTGLCSAELAAPLTEGIGLHKKDVSGWIYWPVRVLLIFPIYQVLLLFFGWIFGQFRFFWAFEKKMLKRLGLGFLFS